MGSNRTLTYLKSKERETTLLPELAKLEKNFKNLTVETIDGNESMEESLREGRD